MVTAQNKAEWSDYTALVDTNVPPNIDTKRDLDSEHERTGAEWLSARKSFRRSGGWVHLGGR
jgi:hypothetical protein